MPKQEGTVVIPKMDGAYGIRLTTQAVTELSNQANGDRALRSILEHDSHYLPLGKVAEISVEDRSEDILVTTAIDDTYYRRYLLNTSFQ